MNTIDGKFTGKKVGNIVSQRPSEQKIFIGRRSKAMKETIVNKIVVLTKEEIGGILYE